MKLPPECWCFARDAGKAPTFWVNSYAETSLKQALDSCNSLQQGLSKDTEIEGVQPSFFRIFGKNYGTHRP
ncbi:hypothetical protein [Leptolyngbya sp. FACHB-16]|uniref:hypothetical protein n=1 Tax=unclassified Leptolyngbya TaxID=2650499 RepID=UPI001689382E|nr:hypothetical protein [Leptolyngbya sp. FACHB-16]MBD2153229.1 hypothetical protein [Leptolyngbya sp. FACHB-16]